MLIALKSTIFNVRFMNSLLILRLQLKTKAVVIYRSKFLIIY